MISFSNQNERSYVGDEDLGATTHGSTTVASSKARSAEAATASKSAAEATATSHTAASRVEARLGLTVLEQELVLCLFRSVGVPYLANVDEAAHEVSVAHDVDGVLGLFLRGVLNDATSLDSKKRCVSQNQSN